jgi:hypothetical protein
MRLVTALGLGLALVATAAGATGVDARAHLERAGGAPVAGQQFRVIAGIEGRPPNASPPFAYAATFTLSGGLAFVKVSQEFNAAQCTRSGSSASCTGNVIGGDIYADSYRLDLRAARAGTYSVRNVVRIVGQADADPSNNDADLAVVVGEAPLAVSGFRLSPSPPRAGRALQATLLLARGGVPARPARVVCAAKVGGRAITGRPVRLANGGRCLWSLRASARGKRLAGSIAATAGGKTFTRRFAAIVR